MAADQAIGDRVEGARPGKPNLSGDFADDALRAPRHLERRAAREGEQQDALRVRALENQMRHAVRERVGLAGAGTRENQQRPGAMARRRALRGVQFFELVRHLHPGMILYIRPVPEIGLLRSAFPR